jgi:hypothetical protein
MATVPMMIRPQGQSLEAGAVVATVCLLDASNGAMVEKMGPEGQEEPTG